jgi:hypothetical protein
MLLKCDDGCMHVYIHMRTHTHIYTHAHICIHLFKESFYRYIFWYILHDLIITDEMIFGIFCKIIWRECGVQNEVATGQQLLSYMRATQSHCFSYIITSALTHI